MNQKERLVEVLDNAFVAYVDARSLEPSTPFIADKILADGWMRLPCEVYKDVYLIVNGIIERCTVEGIHYTRRKNYVRLRPYHQEYLGNWSKYYTPSLRSFGKTVFTSREDAEKALKG